MHGIPMVATSPVRHDSPVHGGPPGGGGGPPVPPGGGGPVDIQSYEPPWKALSDFALHTDLDRLNPNAPHFQHLVNQMHGYPPSEMGPQDGPPGMGHPHPSGQPPMGPLGPPPPAGHDIPPFHHGLPDMSSPAAAAAGVPPSAADPSSGFSDTNSIYNMDNPDSGGGGGAGGGSAPNAGSGGPHGGEDVSPVPPATAADNNSSSV